MSDRERRILRDRQYVLSSFRKLIRPSQRKRCKCFLLQMKGAAVLHMSVKAGETLPYFFKLDVSIPVQLHK